MIASRRFATVLKLCPNQTEDDELLCERCQRRERGGKAQSIALHNLLTEPIPEWSHIYGGPWYDIWTKKHEREPSLAWKMAAEAAQKEGEQRCRDRGVKGWCFEEKEDVKEVKEKEVKKKDSKTFQEEEKEEEDEMVKRMKKAEEAAAAAYKAAQGTKSILTSFPTIKHFYQESEKEVKMLPTDSIRITKQHVDGKEVWVTEDGHMFEVDTDGEPGDFMGMKI